MKIFLSLFFMISMLNTAHSALGLHEIAALEKASFGRCECNFLEDARGGSCVPDTDYQGVRYCFTACRAVTKAYRCGLASRACEGGYFSTALGMDEKCSKLEAENSY